jgi:hypothetical protein
VSSPNIRDGILVERLERASVAGARGRIDRCGRLIMPIMLERDHGDAIPSHLPRRGLPDNINQALSDDRPLLRHVRLGIWDSASFVRVLAIQKYSDTRANDSSKKRSLMLRRRVELKAELHHRFRVKVDQVSKVRSQTWHLASILEHDAADPTKCRAFWRKINDKLKSFELSKAELKAIREKI